MQKIKKPISVLLSLIMILSLFTAVPFNVSAFGDYSNPFTDGRVSLDSDTGEMVMHAGSYDDCNSMFANNPDITSVYAEPGVVLAGDCANMFANCYNLKSVDLTNADMSGVTDTEHMFYNCTLCESIDISGADTSSVTDMSSMFSGCRSLTELDISGINTTSVINMSSMF